MAGKRRQQKYPAADDRELIKSKAVLQAHHCEHSPCSLASGLCIPHAAASPTQHKNHQNSYQQIPQGKDRRKDRHKICRVQ